MKKDKNGYLIEKGDFLLIKTDQEEKMCVIQENDNYHDECLELIESSEDIFPSGDIPIDLNIYLSEQLEIMDYEEVKRYFGVE